jgi:CRP-like cAMP-binding protein
MAELRLLESDPDLAEHIPPADLPLARRSVTARTLVLEPGPWDPSEISAVTETPARALVVQGLLARDVVVAGRRSRQLLGPGHPLGRTAASSTLLPAAVRWTAIEKTVLALLGRAWLAAIARWPGLAVAMNDRIALLAERLAVHQAISQLPRVEDRLFAVLLHLAEDWGTVTPEGVQLDLGLTHKELGQLVGAERPTVSLALTGLAESRAVRRQDSGWLLDPSAVKRWGGPPDEPPKSRRGPRRHPRTPLFLDAEQPQTGD